ncbi:MAG TPA: ATP-binding protein [Ignavibacteriaceae bacterium]|nr:ATP-binding protein [Ignavibacteriaceae bacterium]HRP94101.1 ATP-binding protein [Ignavibacteriaceae bacterium]HRQ53043.1 ATP-binding protein [Ignavibacteriaceae bacterium]
MKDNKSIIGFIFNPKIPFLKERYDRIKEETGKYLVTPLKVIALMVAISGIFAMIFEVRHHAEYSFDIYLVRLSATLVAFIILVFLTSKNATKYTIPLVHILLLSIIGSSAIMILLIPNSLIVNSQIVGLMIFTSAMFLNWEIKNQILVAIYYNIVFAVAILFNDQKIYFLPNMFESLIFVLFLSLLSVVGSAINFRMRLQVAQNALRVEQSERKFRAIFNNSSDGIFQSTLEGDFLTANDSLVRMFGHENLDELIITRVSDYYKNKSDRERLLYEVKKHGSVENFITTLVDKHKDDITVKMNVRFVTDEETDRKFLEGTIRDVSVEVKAQKLREQAELELKAEKEKSDALAKEAMKLSTAKSRFLANMSHEIRTPMNGIIGFLSLIENESYKNQDELKQFIRSAKVSAESLLDTINAVLDLSKIEAGKIELEYLNFNLKKVVTQAVSIVSPKAKENTLNITYELPEDNNLNFIGDPTRIRQIFLNLLSNAVKFTKEGEIKIAVKTNPLEKGRVRISTSIFDSGIGIPADKIKELFKPFSQITGIEGNSLGGTGLGLVICKEFTSLMEGDISVDSVVGEGSRFDFSIVVQQQDVDNSQTQKEEAKNAQDEIDEIQFTDADIKLHIDKRKGFKILLAEDNLINQKVAIRTLNSAGYEVDAVMNGEQAVRAHTQNKYDLILMDVQMPDVDGFAATKMIRALKEPKNKIPIIAITAHALIGDREKCIEAGMDEYVAKPMVAREIIRLIDHFLKVNYTENIKVKDDVYDLRLFDFERLKQISLGDQAFEKDLLTDYLVDAEHKLQLLRDLHSSSEVKKIMDMAHTLKGSSYSVGAKLVGDESLGIEISARNNDLGNVGERLPKLSKSIKETREVLRNKIA